MLPTFALILTAAVTSVTSQSASPGVGTNPAAEGATEDVTPGAGPNGSEDWFNTGLKDAGGWNPPHLDFDSVIHIDEEKFYAGPGKACQQYSGNFAKAGNDTGIKPVILAFIAMQESSCQASAQGPTPGLMQVACENYPGGKCTKDLQDNVNAGANYLKGQLQDNGNNAILAIGSYNGWFKGMTESYPCSEKGKENGLPQNLDYLQQTLNGWFMGMDVYGDQSWIGTYKCSGTCGSGNLC